MKTPTNIKKVDIEVLKISNLSNKIVCRPPQSRETIPLTLKFLNCFRVTPSLSDPCGCVCFGSCCVKNVTEKLVRILFRGEKFGPTFRKDSI